MQRSKKILIIFLISFLFGQVSLATSNCSWTKAIEISYSGPQTGPVSYSYSKDGCPDDSIEKSSCDESLKKDGYLCCCYEETQLETPKFVLPDFQVDIPGLTAYSDPVIVTDDKGGISYRISWISEYIFAIYTYALTIVGVIATLIIMAGGLLWLTSGGDATKIGQAKKLITGSITGLLMLVSMNLLLRYINPDLIKLKGIELGKIADTEPVSSVGNPRNSTECFECESLSPIVFKDGGLVNKDLKVKLLAALNADSSLEWRVTEAYPPTVKHNSTCHYNGTCVDIALTNPGSKINCVEVDKLISTLRNNDLVVFNEYISCRGTQTVYGAGGHLHVR